MRLLSFALLFLIAIGGARAQAQPRLDQPFLASDLTTQEIRYLQGAMAFEGWYDGLLDGKWGSGSNRALQEAVRTRFDATVPNRRHVARIARSFGRQLDKNNWKPVHVATSNTSFQLPGRYMTRTRTGEDVRFSDSAATLQIRSLRATRIATVAMHAKVVLNTVAGTPDYQVMRDDRMITSSQLKNGKSIYLRSDGRGYGFASTSVQWAENRQKPARLIIASLRAGTQEALTLPRHGALQRWIDVLNGVIVVTPKPAPKPAPQPAPAPQAARFVATAFYINNTDVITAASLTRTCAAPVLADGTALKPVRNTRSQGLVLMTSTRRSDSWLRIGAPVVPDRDETLLVYRHEGPARGDTNLVPVSGTVLSLAELRNRAMRLLVSVPPKRGSLGAPVLNARGQVVGVVVERPEDLTTGTPGKVSFVAPAVRFATALTRVPILFERPNQAEGLGAAGPLRAIVPVFCQ